MTRLDAYRRIVGEDGPRYQVTQAGKEDRMETIWPELVKAYWESLRGVRPVRVRKAPVRKGRR